MTDAATIDPQRTALLVMDYQQAIVGMIEDSDALVARAAEAIDLVRGRGGHVGYVRVAFTDADLQNIPPTSRMGARIAVARRRPSTTTPPPPRSTSGWPRATATSSCARPASAPSPRRTSRSSCPSAESTRSSSPASARAASSSPRCATRSDRDYALYVLSDATADREASVHACLMEQVFPRQADVITVAELDGLLAPG